MRARLLGLLVKNLGLTFDIVHRGTSTSAQGVFVGAHVSMSRTQDTIPGAISTSASTGASAMCWISSKRNLISLNAVLVQVFLMGGGN